MEAQDPPPGLVPGETLILGIGQGYMQATPIQLAQMTALLANKGHWIRPHLAKTIDGQPPVDPDPMPDIVLRDPANWDRVDYGMQQVVHGARGTARKVGATSAYLIAGKSGTAQVVAIKQNERYDRSKLLERHRDHALFVGFAPANNPQIAVAVMVENGESGSGVAAPVVKQVMDAWLLDEHGKLKAEYAEPVAPLAAAVAKPEPTAAEPEAPALNSNFDRTLSNEDVMRRRASLLQRLHIDGILLLLLLILGATGLFVLYSASGKSWDMLMKQATSFGLGLGMMVVIAQIEPRFMARWVPLGYLVGVALLVVVDVIGHDAKGRRAGSTSRGDPLPALGVHEAADADDGGLVPVQAQPAAGAQAHGDQPGDHHHPVRADPETTRPRHRHADPRFRRLRAVRRRPALALDRRRGVGGGADRSGDVVLHHARLPETAGADLPRPGKRPAGHRLEHHPVEGGHRFRRGIRQGLAAGHPVAPGFLPESHTDFIIAVLGEEFGLVGVCLLLVLYLLLISRGLVITAQAQTLYGKLLAGGITMTFFVYVFVNIGMVSGLLPVVGVPLPFISYGGTSLVTLLSGFGVLMSIHTHRKWIAQV